MRQLYLASGNAHKLEELQAMATAAKADFALHSANAVGGMPDVVEDAETFIGNARKKAVALAELLPPGDWALADDSGLCVDALDGAPGIYSARFAGEGASDAENNTKLLSLLEGKTADERRAKFVCVLVVRNAEGEEFVFEGASKGRLSEVLSGVGGFGYDPMFCPDGFEQSFAELGAKVKARLSHRAVAFQRLLGAF
jgi:XTP/dITP diphosphohydrolase|tara:strand:- start:220 stop:813 length:594 start_codon:yes stop_codon:yes gene_type:complete